MNLPPSQTGRLVLRVQPHKKGSTSMDTLKFVVQQLTAVLESREILASKPPPLDVAYSYMEDVGCVFNLNKCSLTLVESLRTRRLHARPVVKI